MIILRKIYTFLIDSVQTFLIAAAVFLFIYALLFRPFEVKGDSMFPSFHDGEYVITNLIGFEDLKVYHATFGSLKLGDVVVFNAPPATQNTDKDYIKRIIGVPGDTVSVKDGNVYLNGKILDESAYLKSDVKTYGAAFLKDGDTVKVPQGQYFVMGDNRMYSSDSREWGFITRDEVIGGSLLVYWPITQMRFIKNPY
jgi:signal peptidase I